MAMENNKARKILEEYPRFPRDVEGQMNIIQIGTPRGRVNAEGRRGGLSVAQCSLSQVYCVAERIYKKAEQVFEEEKRTEKEELVQIEADYDRGNLVQKEKREREEWLENSGIDRDLWPYI